MTLREDVTSGSVSPGFERSDKHVGNRVFGSATIMWVATMILRALQLLTTAVLARLLTPNDYGIVALATTVIGFLDILSNLQVGGAIMRSKELTHDHLDTAFTLNLIRGFLTAVMLAVIAHPLAIYMGESRLEPVLYVLTISALFGGIHNTHFLLYSRNIDFSRDSKRNSTAAIVGSIFGIGAAILIRSYWALVIGSIATSFTMAILSYWKVPGKPRLCLTQFSEFISFGKWLILINILNYFNGKLDYFLIGKGFGNHRLGEYHIGQQVSAVATGDVIRPIGNALLPAFAVLASNVERLRNSYKQLQSITLALALPIGFGTSVLAHEVVLVLVGKQWDLAVPVIQWLSPLTALQATTASIEALALSMNHGNKLLWRTVIYFIVRSALMFTGFWLGGFMGIIYGRVVSGTFFLFYSLGLAASITGSKMLDPVMASWRSLISVAIMWCALFMLPVIRLEALPYLQLVAVLAGKIIFGGVIYIGVHAVLWRLAGYPAGAERRLVEQVARVLVKVTAKFKPA